ncbi:MAG: protein kinase [Chloroflexi bacterium]|nr:protein kinase [Chloroflexota bacterium]
MSADLTGRELGNYRIIAEIGRGGMGTVYRAYDPRLQREVAIKVLRPELITDPQVVQRFQREAVTAANLKHPNIVIVHDVGMAEGYQYIVMELLRGHTLTREIQERGALALHCATHMLAQLASALDHAHQHGLVHRDVKSSNVIVGHNDHVTLTDFGLVKALEGKGGALTQAGMALGTLNYMAPEQVVGDPVDRHADIQALGVLAFEMLTGRLPFQSESPHQTIMDIMHTPPPSMLHLNPTLDAGVEPVLQRALAKHPAERFSTASELVQALHRLRAAKGLQLVSSGGQRTLLRPAGASLGRGPDNDVVIRETEVSRYHARIYCEAASWFVVDLGSTNGTFVNERNLTPHEACPLAPGDTLRLGHTTVFQVTATGVASMARARTMSLRQGYK